MIPVILKGETSKPIQLTLREGYVYSGCVLAVCFRGVMKTFTDLVAGGTVELLYTAEETSTFPLGTGKVGLSIQNSAGDICFMPWAKIKVTDSPDEVHDAQITIDPATLNVSDATSKDSLGAVKSKLNAVLAFLRGLSSLAVLALPLYALSDVAPLYSAFEDIPGDEQVVTNVVPYVDAKITAATNAIPQAELPEYWPLYAVTNRDGTPVSSSSFDGLNIDGIGAMASDAWQMATDALGGLSGVAQSATNYTDAVAAEFENGTRQVESAQYAGSSSDAMFAYKVSGDNWDDQYNANDLIRESTNAATAVADAKISTNNAAFVSAVLAVPLTGADAGDLAEIAEYGSYGTVGAAILALIAGLAALKRRMATAETAVSENATAVASVRADLPYALVTPGEWEYTPSVQMTNFTVTQSPAYSSGVWSVNYYCDEYGSETLQAEGDADALIIDFGSFLATRASLPGHLLDRAGNRVEVSGDTTLTLPAANPGYIRDFLVRLEISGSTVPSITFAAPTGETIAYETDGDEFPVPDEAGDWLYSFTESCVSHKFAVSLKKVNTVAQGGA